MHIVLPVIQSSKNYSDNKSKVAKKEVLVSLNNDDLSSLFLCSLKPSILEED